MKTNRKWVQIVQQQVRLRGQMITCKLTLIFSSVTTMLLFPSPLDLFRALWIVSNTAWLVGVSLDQTCLLLRGSVCDQYLF